MLQNFQVFKSCKSQMKYPFKLFSILFCFQKDSPSVAELAGKLKGHILPTPNSNKEVTV